MTMLDDDRLASVLAEAALSFDVPADGPKAIIARARSGHAEAAAVAATAVTAGPTGAPPDAEGGSDDRQDDTVGSVAHAGRLRRATGAARRHRLATVAACFVALLVALAAVGALTRPTSPQSTSSLARPHAHLPVHSRAPAPAPPGVGNTTPQPQFKALAPTSSAVGADGGSPLARAGSGTSAAAAPSDAQLPSYAVGRSSRIEQSGTLGLTVGRGAVARTVTALTVLAGAHGGFVAHSETQSGVDGAPHGSVTLEVPVDSFAAVLKKAETLGRPSGVSTKATDVTGQYVDLQARIAALESSRQQYLTLMTRATTIGDVLSVQEQIDTIQSQLEQLQGQLQVLTSETSYSTLTTTVDEASAPPRRSPLPQPGLVQAWHQSLGGFVDGVEGIVRFAGPALFALACLGGVLLGGRALWRRYRRRYL